jgi:hypothetical protein
MLKRGALVFGEVMRNGRVRTTRDGGRSHSRGAEVLSDSSEYFSARACGEQALIDHLVKDRLHNENAERPGDTKSGFKLNNIGFKVRYSLVGGKHLRHSRVGPNNRTIAEAAGESIPGGGGLA